MSSLLYRCPATGQYVQTWLADHRSENDSETYETVPCMSCGGIHLVNPKTGKTLGTNEK